jgi:hypothetical protein
VAESWTWTIRRGPEGHSAHLIIWRGKYSTKLFKKIDERHPLDLREDRKDAEKTNRVRRGEKKQIFPQYDNFWPRTSAATSAEMESNTFEVVPQPPYFLDFELSDLWLFVALTKHLKVFHFTCNEETD